MQRMYTITYSRSLWGDATISRSTQAVVSGNKPASGLMQLRNTYRNLEAGTEYYSIEWGRCDPEEFLSDVFVRNVLDYCRNVFRIGT